MAVLSYAQLRAYAAAAGAADPDLAAAVALAESGGVTTKHNTIGPDDSYGVWQINMKGDLGPDRRKKLGLSSNSQLLDPATNARAMAMISNGGTNFNPWTEYKNGGYKKFLKRGNSGEGTGDSGTAVVPAGITDVPGDVWGGIKDIAGVIVDAANWMANPSNWLRVAYVIGGVSVALVGLALVLEKPVFGGDVTDITKLMK